MKGARAVLIAVLCALALAAGCRSRQTGGLPAGPPVVRGKPPAYTEVAAGYNTRVAPFERLWTRATVQISYPNEQGKTEKAQLEGHLQYLRPRRVLLTLGKVGDTYAILGSNETQYWWAERNEKRVAFVGDHAKVNAQRVAKLGLPVHPLDLIELLGVTELPASVPGTGTGEAVDVRWSDDGHWLIVTAPGRPNRRRLWLDPNAYEPGLIELIGADGKVVVSAELKGYERVQLAGAASPPRIATEVQATAQEGKLKVRLRMGDPEVSDSKPKEAVFDFRKSLALLGVKDKDVVWLDK